LILVAAGIIICWRNCKNKEHLNNSAFVNSENQNIHQQEGYNDILFQSGIWSSRYFQYGRWYGPHQFPLSFDVQLMKITGVGSDDVGTFTIDGIYSLKTNRIGLTKIYQAGTGDSSKNFGHQVTIKLTWNAKHHLFDGSWYIQTDTYYDQAEFQLKFQNNRT
jgi:hypothetical protein